MLGEIIILGYLPLLIYRKIKNQFKVVNQNSHLK